MIPRSLIRIVPLLAAVLLRSFTAYADEGMWMVHAISKALEADMKAKGLKLNANEIYNADAEGASLKDAVVSLDFGCSGRFSPRDSISVAQLMSAPSQKVLSFDGSASLFPFLSSFFPVSCFSKGSGTGSVSLPSSAFRAVLQPARRTSAKLRRNMCFFIMGCVLSDEKCLFRRK